MSVETPKYVLQKAPEQQSFIRRHWLMVSLAVLAILTYLLGRYTNIEVLEAFQGQQKTLVAENQDLLTENEALKFQVSQWKTESQVKTQAINELQVMLAEQASQINELKSEVEFFEGLLSSKEPPKGLRVFKVSASEVEGLTQIQVVLAQKLTKVQEKTGSINLWLRGIENETGKTLDLTNQFDLEQSFKLKYFQVMNFTIKIPSGFNPSTLGVKLSSKNNKPNTIESQFEWSKITQG